ncbi:hypothetical protein GN156_15050 [bacterium LRH843]|nr:hypothetical protein [bacterium LRH843]
MAAINIDTGENEMALVTVAGIANERKVWKYQELSYSPNEVRGSSQSLVFQVN